MLGVVSRFRVLVVAFSIAVFVFLFGFANLCYVPWSVGWLRLVDTAFWVLSMGSMFAGFARFSSAIYSLLKTSFYIQVFGGSIVDDASYRLTLVF